VDLKDIKNGLYPFTEVIKYQEINCPQNTGPIFFQMLGRIELQNTERKIKTFIYLSPCLDV
jgi:hypothetical protein